MNNLPRQKLLEIIRRHGREIINEPRRCEGLMRDNFPALRREVSVLNAALEERIPTELLAAGTSRTPRNVLLARLVARLHNEVAIEESAARWAVHTWAYALGLMTSDELAALEPASEPINQAANKQTPPAPSTATRPLPSQPSRIQPTPAPQTPVIAPNPPGSPARSTSPPRTSFVVALDGSGDFPSLTDAIRRVPAGARLLVRPGVYHEGLVIDKALEIVGDGALEQIIVRATTSSCVVMRSDAATIRNLTLRGQARAGGAHDEGFFAVDIAHGRPLLDACDISSDSLACVAIHNPTAAPVLRGCRIHHGVDSGIFAFDKAQGVVEACDIFENANIAVALTGGATTSLTNCHIHHGADAGVVIWNRAANTIEGCDIYSNRRTNVGVSDAGVAILSRCRIHDGENTGVFTHRAGRTTIEACNIYGHAEAEVAVTGGGDVRLRNSQVHDGQAHGVFVGHAGRAFVESSDLFRNRESGLHVDENGIAVAHTCRINDNGHVGVSCDPEGAVEVEGCDLTGNRIAAWQTHHGSQVLSRNNRL